MFLILLFIATTTAQYTMVRLDPSQYAGIIDAIGSGEGRSQEIIDRLQAINPVYEARNMTSLVEITNLIPSKYNAMLRLPVGTVHDFEIVATVSDFSFEHSSLPVAYFNRSEASCKPKPAPQEPSYEPPYASLFNKGTFHYANPKVCTRRGDNLMKQLLFDFPEELRLTLLQSTNYMWAYEMYYPAAIDGFAENCVSNVLHNDTLHFRFRQLQRLNETEKFDTADYETSLYNVAVDGYRDIDWTNSRLPNLMDTRIAFGAFRNSGIMLQAIGGQVMNFYAGYFQTKNEFLPKLHPLSPFRTVSVHNPVLNDNQNLIIPNVTAQLLTYDYSDRKVRAVTYDFPYAYPVETAGTGSSENYRPKIVIRHSNLQNTYNNSDIPLTNSLILLGVRYYSQNLTTDCYDYSFANPETEGKWVNLGPSDFENVQDTNEFWIQHFRPKLQHVFEAPPVENTRSNECGTGLFDAVTSECDVVREGRSYKHNNLPMLSRVHDPFLAYTRHTFQLSGRPYSHPLTYFVGGERKTINRTVYVPPLATYTPITSFTGVGDIPYPPAFKKIYSKAESISQTVQGVVNDVKSVIDKAWEIFAKFEEVLGAVESFFEDPNKIWDFAKEKGFFGSVEKAVAWFARENFPV